MSLDKAILYGKEHRKEYAERGKPGRTDPTCRPHGGGYAYPCLYCQNSRLLYRKRFDELVKINLDEACLDI